MPVHEPMSGDKLIEFLDSEVNKLLVARQVYDIGNYGWLSADEVDPEYVGHAMWQTTPPVEPELEWMFGEGLPRHKPSTKEISITVTGHDFEGLMQAARLSIGLVLMHQPIAKKNPINDNSYFWLHHTDAFMHLSMASDRIREYVTIAFWGKNTKKYNKQNDERKSYTTPFRHLDEERGKCENKPAASEQMMGLADTISNFRRKRNEIVHEIATKLGKTNKEILERQRFAHENNEVAVDKETLCFEDLKLHQYDLEARHEREINQAVDELIAWYKALVNLSSLVFEAEYWLRKLTSI